MSISCDPAALVSAAKCFTCVPKGARRWVRTYLFCKFVNNPRPAALVIINDWVNRVQAHGGAAPSANTIQSLIVFVETLILTNLWNQMVAVCCFVPDNLIAAITPILVGGGNDPWTNNNFVDADLVLAVGLRGDAATKFLDTGINPAIALSPASAGLTFCTEAAYLQAPVRHDMGCYDTGIVNAFELSMSITGSNLGVASYNYGADLNVVASNGFKGFVSANCNSVAPSVNIFTAAFSQPFGTALSTAACAGALPSRSIYMFARNEDGVAGGFTQRSFAFAAIHQALNATQANDFYNAIQAFRTALGAPV